MTNDLRPCPFCGGEARLKEYKPTVSGVAICTECGARSPICRGDHTGGWEMHAADAWNRRAERTCRVVSAKECGGVGYAPGCSECGWQMAGSMWHNYCPNCGARVIREETDNAD